MRTLVFSCLLLLTTAGCARRSATIAMPTWNFAPPVQPPPSPAAGPRLWVDSFGGLGLFSDESFAVEGQVAAWAGARGWNVVDPARTRQVVERARFGQDPRSGLACGLPLSRSEALRRWGGWLGAQGRIDADVRCDKTHGCNLTVEMTNDVDLEGQTLARFVAPFDTRAPWPEALHQAFGVLAPANGGDEGGGGVIGGVLGGSEVHAQPERLTFSTRPARAQDDGDDGFEHALSFPEGQAPLRGCFTTEDSVEMLVEIGGGGNLARCESRDAPDAVSSCICEAFTRHAVGAPAVRTKRAFVIVHFSPADAVTSWGAVVHARVNTYLEKYSGRSGHDHWRPAVSDPSIADWDPPKDDRVASCLTDAAQRGSIEVAVRVTFDATGRAAAVAAQGRKPPTLSRARRACLEAAFLGSRAPCPTAPSSTADAVVTATVRPITR